jgi:hypothetical protein
MTSTLTQQLFQVIINHLLGGFIDESKYKFANNLKYSDKKCPQIATNVASSKITLLRCWLVFVD